MSTITIENRPIQAGIYTQETILQGSNISLQQAQQIVKSMGSSNSISSDGKGAIGLWRMKRADRPDLLQYNTQPPRAELFSTMETQFVPGAALAWIPTGAPYVTAIYNSFVLQENIETPAGWIPKTTLVDQAGKPISEISTTGQSANLQQGSAGIAGIGQFDYAASFDQYGDFDDAGFDDDSYFGSDDSSYFGDQLQAQPAYSGDSQYQPVPAIGPLAAAFMPYVAKGILWIGGLAIAYFAGRHLLVYVAKIVFKQAQSLFIAAKKATSDAIKKAGAAGLLIPIALGGLALAYGLSR